MDVAIKKISICLRNHRAVNHVAAICENQLKDMATRFDIQTKTNWIIVRGVFMRVEAYKVLSHHGQASGDFNFGRKTQCVIVVVLKGLIYLVTVHEYRKDLPRKTR